MGVEVGKLLPHISNHLHLLKQNCIKRVNVHFNVALGFFHILQQGHVLLNNIDDVVNMLPVVGDQLFFLFENDLDQILMVAADELHVVTILLLKLLIGFLGNVFDTLELWRCNHEALSNVLLHLGLCLALRSKWSICRYRLHWFSTVSHEFVLLIDFRSRICPCQRQWNL